MTFCIILRHLAVFGYLAVSGSIWCYLVVSGGVLPHLAYFCAFYVYSAELDDLSGSIWRYLAVSGYIWQYLIFFNDWERA